MFSNTFKRRKDKNADSANEADDAASSASPTSSRPEEGSGQPLTPPDTPGPEARSLQDGGRLLAASQEARTADGPRRDDGALKPSIDVQSETTETVTGSSPGDDRTTQSSPETTVVDPNDGIPSSPPVDIAVFDTTAHEFRKSDLWALAAELEEVRREKAQLQQKMGEQMGVSGKRVGEMKAGVGHCAENINRLESLLREEQERTSKTEEAGNSKLVVLQEKVAEQEVRVKVVEGQLAEEKTFHERMKLDFMEKMKKLMERVELSEEKAKELALEGQHNFERVEILEGTLRGERKGAKEVDEEAKQKVAKLVQEKLLQAKTIKSLELKEARLTEQIEQQDKERRILLEGVSKSLQACLWNLKNSVDTLRQKNEKLIVNLEANSGSTLAWVILLNFMATLLIVFSLPGPK